jgi:hypothetical protein
VDRARHRAVHVPQPADPAQRAAARRCPLRPGLLRRVPHLRAGHPWTNYTDSWQWDAQNFLITISFIVSLAGLLFLLNHRRRRAVILTFVSLGLSAIFILWVQLSPPVGSD